MYLTRRLLLGIIIGLTIVGLLLTLVDSVRAMSGSGITVAELGGTMGLLVAGVVIGGSYACLFQPERGGHTEHLMSGVPLGLIVWVILAMNVYPWLTSGGPMWEADIAISLFPQLIAYLLLGSVVGLVYGLVYQLLAKPLRLARSELVQTPPLVSKRIVIVGGGYAGISAAQKLEQELGDDPTVGIWLVSGTNYLLHTPMLSEVSASSLIGREI